MSPNRPAGVRHGLVIVLAAVAMLLASAGAASAHPGWGIAVDSQGSVYFTDIGDRAIWQLATDGTLGVAVDGVWSHHLYIDDDDRLYFDSEDYQGGSGNSFWVRSPSGDLTELIPSSPYPEYVGEYTYQVDSGDILFAGQWGIVSRSPSGDVSFLAGGPDEQGHQDGHGRDARFGWITGMTRGPDGAIYVVDVVADTMAHLRRVELDGTVETLVDDLLSVPADDPFFDDGTFNLIWDLAVSDDGDAYLAYTGNRRLLRVAPDRSVSELYHASAPWAPVGVTEHEDQLYVLETAFVEGVGHKPPRVRRISTDGSSTVLVTIEERAPGVS